MLRREFLTGSALSLLGGLGGSLVHNAVKESEEDYHKATFVRKLSGPNEINYESASIRAKEVDFPVPWHSEYFDRGHVVNTTVNRTAGDGFVLFKNVKTPKWSAKCFAGEGPIEYFDVALIHTFGYEKRLYVANEIQLVTRNWFWVPHNSTDAENYWLLFHFRQMKLFYNS